MQMNPAMTNVQKVRVSNTSICRSCVAILRMERGRFSSHRIVLERDTVEKNICISILLNIKCSLTNLFTVEPR